MTRALRPEGINWPISDEGKPTNRLELITKANGISHESAHDAMSDVDALIDVTRLIREKQPKLFNFLFKLRDKHEIKNLITLENPQPFVYSSGRFGSEHNFTTVCIPALAGKNGNILVFDLRYNLDELLAELKKKAPNYLTDESIKLKDYLFPKFKELAFNRCPAVAPLNVLDVENGWQKIELEKTQIEQNIKSLLSYPEILERLKNEHLSDKYDKPAVDAETALYDSFVPDNDRIRMTAIRTMDENSLADFHPVFSDERLPELLLHYKAKNFPNSLSEDEGKKWQAYRANRLNRQAPIFLAEIHKFQSDPEMAKDRTKTFLLDELMLWYQSLQDSDY